MFGWIKNIGLSWKVQLAPAFLILVLVGVGAYALQALAIEPGRGRHARLQGRSGNRNLRTILPPRHGWRMPGCIVSRPPRPMKRMRRRSRPWPRKPPPPPPGFRRP